MSKPKPDRVYRTPQPLTDEGLAEPPSQPQPTELVAKAKASMLANGRINEAEIDAVLSVLGDQSLREIVNYYGLPS
jgi:hypothetical protein